MNSLPSKLEAVSLSTHCLCFSGLTESQVRLVKLVGNLEALDFPLLDAVAAIDCPGPDQDADLADALRKFQLDVARACNAINTALWPSGRGR